MSSDWYVVTGPRDEIVAKFGPDPALGDRRELPHHPVQMAILEAKTRLEDDPELGEVVVYGCSEDPEEYRAIWGAVGRAVFSPEIDGESEVVWLWQEEDFACKVCGTPDADYSEADDGLRCPKCVGLPDPKEQPRSERTPEPRMSDADFDAYINDAYADNWAKREGMRQMREAGWC